MFKSVRGLLIPCGQLNTIKVLRKLERGWVNSGRESVKFLQEGISLTLILKIVGFFNRRGREERQWAMKGHDVIENMASPNVTQIWMDWWKCPVSVNKNNKWSDCELFVSQLRNLDFYFVGNTYKNTLSKINRVCFFLSTPPSMWDLSSPTRDWICAPFNGSRVLTTGLPGNSP